MKNMAEVTNHDWSNPAEIMRGWTFLFLIFASFVFTGDAKAQKIASTTGSTFATYYVDWVNGSDSNNGTSKSTPWQSAPGMYTCSNNCAAAVINPGDSIILRGGITWPNAAFPWNMPFSGTETNFIYIGVDKTWYAGSAWTRPIMDLQQLGTNRGQYSPQQEVFAANYGSWVIWDNFEIIDWNTGPGTSPSNNYVAMLFNVNNQLHSACHQFIFNMYVHKWYNPYISIGTGNISAGSCVITNYVPYSYSGSPSSSWSSVPGGVKLQSLPVGTNIPAGNNSPMVTAVSGSNPYSITFTNTAGCPTKNVTGAVIQLGTDAGVIVEGNPGDISSKVNGNVFDGSDTAEVQWNPYPDCGLTEGNNNACLASVSVGLSGPQYWYNNVMRYVSTGFVGSSTQVGGNLMEYFRPGLNPTNPTSVWEEDPGYGSTNAYYDNIIRHMNLLNPNVPGGIVNFGTPLLVGPVSGATSYVFNNVFYDTTAKSAIGINPSNGGSAGTVDVFGNTVEGGPLGNETYPAFSCTANACTVEDNLAITTAASPFGTCGSGCTQTNNLTLTPTQATSYGYTNSEAFALSPISASNPTVGAGTNASSFCAGLSSLTNQDEQDAQSACLNDTSYAVSYDYVNHVAVVPGRTGFVRPTTGSWDIGAYQYSSTPVPHGDLDGTANGQVTLNDAVLVAQYAVGLISLTPSQIQAAEVSSSTESAPSWADAVLIAQYAVGLISTFPVQS